MAVLGVILDDSESPRISARLVRLLVFIADAGGLWSSESKTPDHTTLRKD